MRDARDQRRLSRRDVVLGAAAAGGAAAIGGSMLSAQSVAAAPVQVAAQAPASNGVEGIFDGWLGTVLDVASVAMQVLPMILLARNGVTAPPIQIGNMQLQVENLEDVVAYNIGSDPIGMCYSATRSSPSSNVSLYDLVKPTGKVSCLGNLDDFADGQLYLASAPDQIGGVDNTPSRTVSFAVRGLMIGSTIKIVGGIKLSVIKDPGTGSFSVSIDTGGSRVLSAEITAVSGASGNAVRAKWKDQTIGPPLSNIAVPLPSGVNLDPVVESLDLYLELDAAQLDQMVADSRRSR